MSKKNNNIGVIIGIIVIVLIGMYYVPSLDILNLFIVEGLEEIPGMGNPTTHTSSGSSNNINIPFELFAITSCTPETDYFACYEQSLTQTCYAGGTAIASPKIQATLVSGGSWSGTYVTEGLYVDVKCNGDKLYVYKGITDWNQVSCDSNGCNGELLPYLTGTYFLNNKIGDQTVQHVAFECWDRDDKPIDCWVWIDVGWGWVSTPNYWDWKTVACVNNDNCNSGESCDITTHTCKITCVEDWNCGEWTPSICPSSSTQTRTCIDSNNCGTNLNVPITNQGCLYVPCNNNNMCDAGETVGGCNDCTDCSLISYNLTTGGPDKCVGYDLYRCIAQSWTEINFNSTFCGYGITTCIPTSYTPTLSSFCGTKSVTDNCGTTSTQTGTLSCPYGCSNNVCSSTCTSTEIPEKTCDDSKDNDCDGKIDSLDTDCEKTTLQEYWYLFVLGIAGIGGYLYYKKKK